MRRRADIRNLLTVTAAAIACVVLSADAHADEATAGADAGVAPAGADDATTADTEVAPVVVHANRDADDPSAARAAPQAARALDDPAFVSITVLDDEHHEATTVGEVMARSVGVNVRSLGGLGAFTSISVRGAPSSQTVVLVDGVPLSRMAFSAIDLSSFDLATYDGVEVYRGGVPVEMGGAALGGAVNFTTGIGPQAGQAPTTLSLAGGSFGARQARAVRRDRFGGAGRLATTVSLGYAGASGDFAYFDDNGTPLEPADDATATRHNNGYDQIDGVARARYRGAGGLTVEGGARVGWKQQGVPGLAGSMTVLPELTSRRAVLDVHAARTRAFDLDALDLGGGAHLVLEGQRYVDPEGEIGLEPQDNDYLTVATGGSISAAYAASEHQLLGAALEPRFEWFRERDHLGDGVVATGVRAGGALSISDALSFGDGAWLVVPALRVDLLSTRPPEGIGQAIGTDPAAPHDDLELSPRVSWRWTLRPELALKGSLGRYFRAPTLVELYGHRGFVVGNPGLSSETGLSADLGAVYAPTLAHGALDRVFVETALFGSRVSDLIVFTPTSANVPVARNLEDSLIGGAELSLSGRLAGALTLTGNYTYLATRQSSPRVAVDGKALPGRPTHDLYLRLDGETRVAGWRLAAHVDGTFTDGNYLDVGNQERVPARRFLGAGALVDAPFGVTVALDCRNLLDERVEDVPMGTTTRPRAVADLLGYPLPGRSLMLSASAGF